MLKYNQHQLESNNICKTLSNGDNSAWPLVEVVVWCMQLQETTHGRMQYSTLHQKPWTTGECHETGWHMRDPDLMSTIRYEHCVANADTALNNANRHYVTTTACNVSTLCTKQEAMDGEPLGNQHPSHGKQLPVLQVLQIVASNTAALKTDHCCHPMSATNSR